MTEQPKKPQHLKRLSCDELEVLKELHEAGLSMSYYNAAEGQQYYDEAPARRKAAERLRKAREAAWAIGYDLGGGYLC